MRIINLSAGGDPFIGMLTLKMIFDRCYDEVDKIYVNYNNHAGVPKEVVGEFLFEASQSPKVNIIYHPEGSGNGIPIKEGVLLAPPDALICLIEDDAFFIESGKIDENFKHIENGQFDAIGSPRGSCGQEITDSMCKKYNLDISGYGDRGVNFWPCFLFCKRKDLLNTDLNFASKEFTKDIYYKELDHTMTETQYADTFVWADVQMRYNGVRFGHVPQFHASPYEAEDKENKTGNWIDGKPYWFHGGSLSSGWNGYLSGQTPDLTDEGTRREIESRVAFWTIASDVIDGFENFKIQYKAGIEGLIERGLLSRGKIKEKIIIYKNLLRI